MLGPGLLLHFHHEEQPRKCGGLTLLCQVLQQPRNQWLSCQGPASLSYCPVILSRVRGTVVLNSGSPTVASSAPTPTSANWPCLCRALNGGLGELRRPSYAHIDNNRRLLALLLSCSRRLRLITYIVFSLLNGNDLDGLSATG
jgi:hypothetical protein